MTVLLGLISGFVFYFRDLTPSPQAARQIVEDAGLSWRGAARTTPSPASPRCSTPPLPPPLPVGRCSELGGMACLQQRAPERARQLWSRLPPQSPAWGRIGPAYSQASLSAGDWDAASSALSAGFSQGVPPGPGRPR